MKPIYCRIGSKYLMSDSIIEYFPEHLIYVEPFFGGGGIYWKKKPSEAEIINDLDKGLIQDYKLVKSSSINLKDYNQNLNTLDKLKDFIDKTHNTKQDKLTDAIIRRCSGFSSNYVKNSKMIYKLINPFNKILNIKEYKDRMKNTIILNQDYKKVIHKYDTTETFFYLDPPYDSSSEGIYKDYVINYEEMSHILKNIKGKFILSINKTSYILNIFKDFKIIKIKLKSHAKFTSPIGGKKRTELLIINY